MATWLTLWDCLCTDVCTDDQTFPPRCPGHGSPSSVDAVPELEGPMALGHWCGPKTCNHDPRRNPATEEDEQ